MGLDAAKTGVVRIEALEEDLSSFTADVAYDTIAICDSAGANGHRFLAPPARTAPSTRVVLSGRLLGT